MIKTEKKTIEKMIGIYCSSKHGTSKSLCAECQKLHDYALCRLSACRFGDNKPTCQQCPVHCYNTEMKAQIKKVMKFSGPRMLLYHPLLAFNHLLKELQSK